MSHSTNGKPEEHESPLEFPPNPSIEVVFELLNSRRRRIVLTHLSSRDEPVSLDDLAIHVVATEDGVSPTEVSTDEHQRVYTGLQHTDLRKLMDADVVEYDEGADSVALVDENAGHVEAHLSLAGYDLS